MSSTRSSSRSRSSWFAGWWALVLAHVLFACASGDPGAAGEESVGEIAQAFCQPGQLHCNGAPANECCLLANAACCGSQCINSATTTCCGGVVCPADKDFCVDGVCCATACNGPCQSCSAAAKGSGSDGTCGSTKVDTDPNGDCTPVALSCATGEYCNGAGACQKASASTPCATTACSNGTVTGSLCNGSGTCISSSTSCNPYFCANATSCATTCSSDNDCVANAFCRTSDHTCQSDRAKGLSCSGGSQCVTGNCVDGVCCDGPCNGSCEACSAAKKGSGADGTCANVAEDSDPDSECPDDGAATCKRNGDCDGSGGCKKYESGTSCGSTTCTSGQQSGHSCDGLGSCLDSNVTQCSPYLCSGNACGTTCTSDANCIASSYCRTSDKTCQADQANGKGCSSGSQCSSGKCVDGVCCDTTCDGTCDACTAAKKGSGTDGTCGAIALDTDPDDDCADDGASSCKKDGSCDGNHSCKLYESGTGCGANSCSSGTQTGFACNGLGTCNAASTSPCSPYVCKDTSVCATTCASDAGCVANSYCAADKTCKPDQAKGAVCTAGSQCTSGNCVDGYCCDAPCDGTCQACSAAKTGGANGTCKAISKDTDPDGDCPDDGAPSCDRNGACDGVGACQKYASGTACGGTTCTNGMQAGQACDGSGNCKAGQSSSCSPYNCNGSACGTTCVSDADCVASAFCDATGHCVPDQSNGKACNKASQCTNGNCVDGVCCDQACAGTCQACSVAKKGSGNDGVCGSIKVDTDPDNDCAADAPSTCKNDGNCNGSGACKKYDVGTECGSNQCSGSELTGRQCDGIGGCVNGGTSSCAPYVCLVSSCATSCGDDNGCVTGSFCAGGSCQTKHENGEACTSPHECSSGFCVEGVCCDTACNGVCQACTAENKLSGPDGACDLAKLGTDAHNDCLDEGAISCKHDGFCNGAGACRLYEGGTACGITSCQGNVQTGFACDGSGVCQANAENDCELYACKSGACAVACTDSSDCNETAYCDVADGTCKKKADIGSQCSEPGTCSSGYCVDDVCCDKACAGQCQACDVVTAPGTCSPIVGTPHGVRPACDPGAPDDVCSARACDGEQDTNSCVGYVGAETTCRDQTCSDGVETFSATCDGTGTCGPAGPVKTKKCEPYVCQGDGCGSAPCASDKDCAAKFRCDAVKKDCVPRDVASCDGDHVIGNPDGTTTDCAPFKCEGSVCKDSCASVDDCVSGFVCDAANQCISASSSASSPSACGCRVAGGGTERTPLLLLLLGVAVAARRQRRQRSRLAE